MKIAIIGAGPTAFGALLRLLDIKKEIQNLTMDVFTTGDPMQEQNILKTYKPVYTNRDINKIIKSVKSQYNGLIPQRSFIGTIPQKISGLIKKNNVKYSETFGGIGNYWSSSIHPTHKYFDQYTEKLGDLNNHFSFISKHIPISGQVDTKLSQFFDASNINNPPIPISKTMSDLVGLKKNYLNLNIDLGIGINRFALNTNQEEKNGCVFCGDCMYGCPRDSIFRPSKYIHEMHQSGFCNIFYEKVLRIKEKSNRIQLSTRNNNYLYDKIFLCGGALGTIELILKSYGNPSAHVNIYDNFLYYFPAISFKRKNTRLHDQSFEFAELTGGVFDHKDNSYNHFLVSTIPNSLLDNIFYRNSFSKTLTNLLANHVIFIAVFGSNSEYRIHQCKLDSNKLNLAKSNKSIEQIDDIKINLIRQYFRQFGWRSFRNIIFEHGSSGHYTSNIGSAYRKENLECTGLFEKNVYICDSSTWNNASMSQPHTFTLMANSSRIVKNAFKNSS